MLGQAREGCALKIFIPQAYLGSSYYLLQVSLPAAGV